MALWNSVLAIKEDIRTLEQDIRNFPDQRTESSRTYPIAAVELKSKGRINN